MKVTNQSLDEIIGRDVYNTNLIKVDETVIFWSLLASFEYAEHFEERFRT
jgi:hypothetical protein